MEADLKGFLNYRSGTQSESQACFSVEPACLECVLMSPGYKGEWLTLMDFGPRLNELNDLVADDVKGSVLNPNINKILAPPWKYYNL